MSNTGVNGNLTVKKESTYGTYIAGDFPLRIASESIENKIDSTEDPALIGEIFTTDLIKVGETVSGNIETMAHPDELGLVYSWALGGEAAVGNPAGGWLVMWYTGAKLYCRVTKSGANLSVEVCDDGSTWVADTNFNTTGTIDVSTAPFDTLTELATAINAYTGWDAVYLGVPTTSSALIADFTATNIKSAGTSLGALIKPLQVVSTVSKLHTITPAGATSDLPSYSATINRTLGTNKSVGILGMKVNSVNMTNAAKDLIKLSIGISAQSESVDKNDVTVTWPTVQSYKTPKAKVFFNNVDMGQIKDFAFNLSNNLDSSNVIGSYYITEPIRQGASIELSGSLNLDTTATTGSYQFRTSYTGDTPIEVILYMEGVDLADTGVYYNALFRFNQVKITNYNVPLSGPDRLTISFSGKVVNSTTWDHVVCYITDKKATTY